MHSRVSIAMSGISRLPLRKPTCQKARIGYSNDVTRFASLLLLSTAGFAQTDWPSYGNDPGAMRYSTLRQIHAGNVERLKRAWMLRTEKPGSEAVPVVVDG
jgi:glucose dehydrogenase